MYKITDVDLKIMCVMFFVKLGVYVIVCELDFEY